MPDATGMESVTSVDIWSDEGLPRLYFEITQLIQRYARGADRRDPEILRSAFHRDGIDEHGFSSGSPDEFLEGFMRRHATIPESMHLNGIPLLLEIDPPGRAVLVETNCVSWIRLLPQNVVPGSIADSATIASDSPHARLSAVANRYHDLITERDGALKILYRRVIYEWSSVVETPLERPFPEDFLVSTRDRDDVSYRTLAQSRQDHASHLENVYGE
jgi:hypothetical protein